MADPSASVLRDWLHQDEQFSLWVGAIVLACLGLTLISYLCCEAWAWWRHR